ncbi:hypothetical protein VNO77_02813 [Canavalia gladiata]|uniref:Uncharacterized protein n=1 Tax=Canavalia gladiata TaxID=3824 RepID=A0AAN9RBM1_CANGL
MKAQTQLTNLTFPKFGILYSTFFCSCIFLLQIQNHLLQSATPTTFRSFFVTLSSWISTVSYHLFQFQSKEPGNSCSFSLVIGYQRHHF